MTHSQIPHQNTGNRKQRSRTGGLATVLLVLGILAACSPAAPAEPTATPSPTALPTASPTPTPEPPQPETALENAFQRFESAQSFTVNTTWYDTLDNNAVISTSTDYLNQTDQIHLRERDRSFGDGTHDTKLCLPDTCYDRDMSGLLKPKAGTYEPFRPSLFSINITFEDILTNPTTYVGEEIINGVRMFKYEVQITDEQISNASDPEGSGGSKLIDPRPQAYFYVNAADGFLARKQEIYSKEYFSSYPSGSEIIEDYSAWNSTAFELPEYTDISDTTWVDYSGAYSSVIAFQYPMIYSMSEDSSYPQFETPAGSKMTLRLMGSTIAMISVLDEENVDPEFEQAKCDMAFQGWVLPAFSETQVEGSTEWIPIENFTVCKTLVASDEKQIALYLFNEPSLVGAANGRLLPLTFFASVTPAGGEDITVFWDVIESVRFGSE